VACTPQVAHAGAGVAGAGVGAGSQWQPISGGPAMIE